MTTEEKLSRLVQTLVNQNIVSREDMDAAFAQESIVVMPGRAHTNATPQQRQMLQGVEEDAERYGVTIEDFQEDLDERIRLRDARAREVLV